MFSIDDFAENTQMLSSIILVKMDKPPLSNFHKLPSKEKLKFNILLNEYIKSLPDEGWKEQLTEEYQKILTEEVFTPEFKASDYEPMNINPEIQLLTENEEENEDKESDEIDVSVTDISENGFIQS